MTSRATSSSQKKNIWKGIFFYPPNITVLLLNIFIPNLNFKLARGNLGYLLWLCSLLLSPLPPAYTHFCASFSPPPSSSLPPPPSSSLPPRPQWGARTYSHTLREWTYCLRDLLPSSALSAGLTAKGLWPSPTSVGLRPPGLIAFATHCLQDL